MQREQRELQQEPAAVGRRAQAAAGVDVWPLAPGLPTREAHLTLTSPLTMGGQINLSGPSLLIPNDDKRAFLMQSLCICKASIRVKSLEQ